jgi:hypothetical protein
LGEVESFNTGDVAEVEEPDIGKYFALPNVSCNDAAENVDIDAQVGRAVDDAELSCSQYQVANS